MVDGYKPVSMIESMSTNKQKEMTITELAEEMREGFAAVREQFNIVHKEMRFIHERVGGLEERVGGLETEFREFRKEARDRFDDLEKGLFTEEEKEQMLAMVRHYDKWLEEDTTGKSRITLTREEYDGLMESVRLPNRFVKLETIEVE
jgi:predicted  nucleic acid-binding Zn-ribbon protein